MARRGTTARIDIGELEKLCAMQATDEEIASWFNVSTRTIERRRKVVKFADVMERGRAKGRLSIRRMQIKLLESGNATMAVWLGKQYLGQTDQVEHRADISLSAFVVIPRASPIAAPGFLGPVEPRQVPASEANNMALECNTSNAASEE
jgi:hypothetical protein